MVGIVGVNDSLGHLLPRIHYLHIGNYVVSQETQNRRGGFSIGILYFVFIFIFKSPHSPSKILCDDRSTVTLYPASINALHVVGVTIGRSMTEISAMSQSRPSIQW
jgi:hypothetical protein